MPDNESHNDAALEAAMNGAPEASLGDLESQMAQLQGELQRANNEVLKAQAEMENFRKRMRREMFEEARYAALPLVNELLPALDNLQRAIEAAEQTGATGPLVDGVKMVIGQLEAALAKNGCVKIEALGQEFDPHLHMALMQEPSAEVSAGHVSRVLQSGYKMHDRVVRPVQVFVSTGPAAQ